MNFWFPASQTKKTAKTTFAQEKAKDQSCLFVCFWLLKYELKILANAKKHGPKILNATDRKQGTRKEVLWSLDCRWLPHLCPSSMEASFSPLNTHPFPNTITPQLPSSKSNPNAPNSRPCSYLYFF